MVNSKKDFRHLDGKFISDSDLVQTVLGSASVDRPQVFYRSLSSSPQIKKLLGRSSFVLRPFSFAKPGVRKDIPLSYGGVKDPVLLRIVDPHKEWEDTGPYFGFNSNWAEAFNLNPAYLRKISEGVFKVGDLYRQVGSNSSDSDQVWQGTYAVERVNPADRIKLLHELKGDFGFLRQLRDLAVDFRLSENPYRKKLNEKYLEYFEWAKSISPGSVSDAQAREMLEELQDRISKIKS